MAAVVAAVAVAADAEDRPRFAKSDFWLRNPICRLFIFLLSLSDLQEVLSMPNDLNQPESLEETFDKYMRGKIDNKEKKLAIIAKSKIPKHIATILRNTYLELVKAGFTKEQAMNIIISGAVEI